jgi:hypothetical protein
VVHALATTSQQGLRPHFGFRLEQEKGTWPLLYRSCQAFLLVSWLFKNCPK